MEFLTIFLSSLLGILSPVGGVVDRVAADSLRQQLVAAEQLQVRVDNAPSYALLSGKVQRIRVAGRGVFPLKDIRIALLELETDAVAVNGRKLRRGQVQLQAPLRLGLRLGLTVTDINRALQSPVATDFLRRLGTGVVEDGDTRRRIQRYEFRHPRLTVVGSGGQSPPESPPGGRRLRFQVGLQEPGDPAQLDIVVESGIAIRQGRQLQLIQPIVLVNGEPVPAELLRSTFEGIEAQADLNQFTAAGITARVLQYQVNVDEITLAAFVQVMPVQVMPSPAANPVPSAPPSSGRSGLSP